jgi:hypothetical protein
MPEAGRQVETVRRELKSCPPDGFVVLRQLSYDEMLERRDGGMKILMERTDAKNVDPNMAVQIANKWSNHFTFPRCIVEHNLTIDGQSIDFSDPVKVFAKLNPKIGAEIEGYIDELNQDESETFTNAANGASQDETNKPVESLEKS